MKCKAIQRHLLSLEDPGCPPAEVQAHVDRCPDCRHWQSRLNQIERHVPLLPVPPSQGLVWLQQRLAAEERRQEAEARAAACPPATLGLAPSPWRWRLAVGSLAAAILLCAIGLWALQGPDDPPRVTAGKAATSDPFVTNLMQRTLRLARADLTSPQRIETLADLAGDLHGEVRPLVSAADSEGLAQLAISYGRVVQEGIVSRARVLPAEQRPTLSAIADRLAQAGNDADLLAREASAGRAESLRQIAAAARTGSRQLRDLSRVAAAASPPNDPALTAPAGVRGVRGRGPLFASVTAAPLVATVRADAPRPTGAERARRFQRNCELIQTLVNSSLRLAGELEPLKRAEQCNGVAERLAHEIYQAARAREGARAAEMGQHFRAVLQGGVASNLLTASSRLEAGSTGEQKLRQIGARVSQVAEPLEEQLARAAQDTETREDMQRAIAAVSEGRSEVERVIRTRVRPHDRAADKKS